MKSFLKVGLWIQLIFMLVTLAACRGQADPTPTLAWTPLPVASNVPLATATPTIEAAGFIPGIRDCINDALFLEDLTIPDQTIVTAGERLDKRWSVQNSGTCDWGSGYHLTRIGIDKFESLDEIALYPARSGSTATWQVVLIAPQESGEHISIWQARAPDGALFGQQVYVWVLVATPTPAPTARGTATN